LNAKLQLTLANKWYQNYRIRYQGAESCSLARGRFCCADSCACEKSGNKECCHQLKRRRSFLQ